MNQKNDFTTGPIGSKLIQFMFPILGALFLQTMYSAVDVLVVGRFGTTEGLSGVSTGAAVMNLVIYTVAGFSTGVTVLIARYLGEKENERIGKVIGGSICFFTMLAVICTVLLLTCAHPLAMLMQAPEEAISQTVLYVRICGSGIFFILGYNLISAIMRGLGDSKSPLLFVLIACIVNIVGDLLLVAVLHMDVAGAALATVIAQTVSVLISIRILLKKDLPFTMSRADIRFNSEISRFVKIGFPIALQEFLTSISFLALCAFINNLGLEASSGYGVANRVVNFVCLIPSSLMQSLASFVAQNVGAKQEERAKKAMFFGMFTAGLIGVGVLCLVYFRGDLVAGLFTQKQPIIDAAADYLKGFAPEAVVTAFSFSLIGYFNGHAKTRFVMIQGLMQSFIVRLPFAYFMSIQPDASLQKIGMAAPVATVFGIVINSAYFIYLNRKRKSEQPCV